MSAAKPQPQQNSSMKKTLDVIQPFGIGCISGIVATICVQPIDMIKVRIQIKSEQISQLKAQGKSVEGMSTSPFAVLREFRQNNGLLGLYKGLDAGITRQVFYATTRLGVYKSLFDAIKKKRKGANPTFFEKSYCGLTAGFIGSVVGNPADLALIRIQSDSTLPVAERQGYNGVFGTFVKIIKDEGIASLWRGCTPTVIRAMAINLVMLVSFDEIKERYNKVKGVKDCDEARIIAATISGLLSACASLPFDNAKTKIQKMKKGADGKYPYKNIFDCMMKTVKSEGVTGLWVGLPTFCVRISPHVVITLLVQDFVTNYVNRVRKEKGI